MTTPVEATPLQNTTATTIPVKCQNCQRMFYIPEYCFINGFWYGNIRKTLNFDCLKCGWQEKIIL